MHKENRLALLFVLFLAVSSVQCFAQGVPNPDVLSLPKSAVLTNVSIAHDWLQGIVAIAQTEGPRAKETQQGIFTRVSRLPASGALDIQGLEDQSAYLNNFLAPAQSANALWSTHLEVYRAIGKRMLKGDWKTLALVYRQARPIIDVAKTWKKVVDALTSRKTSIDRTVQDRLSNEPIH